MRCRVLPYVTRLRARLGDAVTARATQDLPVEARIRALRRLVGDPSPIGAGVAYCLVATSDAQDQAEVLDRLRVEASA